MGFSCHFISNINRGTRHQSRKHSAIDLWEGVWITYELCVACYHIEGACRRRSCIDTSIFRDVTDAFTCIIVCHASSWKDTRQREGLSLTDSRCVAYFVTCL